MAKKEYIEREAAFNAIKLEESGDNFDFNEGLIAAMNAIESIPAAFEDAQIGSIPAADVRPVVLCRDCKYWKLSKIEPLFHVCTYVCGATFVRNQDDFCSRGVKREES